MERRDRGRQPMFPSKVILSITFCIAVYASVVTYGYLTTRDELSSLETQYNSIVADLKEVQESKQKLEESHKQDIEHSKQLQEKLTDAKEKEKGLQEQIASIPPKRCPKQQGVEYVPVQAFTADIDDRLPDELIGVLKQSYDQNTRSTNPTPR